MARSMRSVSSSSTSGEASSAKPIRSIQVQLPSWVSDVLDLRSSVITAEKYGVEWFVSIPKNRPSHSMFIRFPARDILINGKSLAHFLEAIATMGI